MEAGCRLRELYNNFNTLWKWLLRSSPSLAKVRARLQEKAAPERWPSGLRRTLGKRVCGKPSRGFESHSLRHYTVLLCIRLFEITGKTTTSATKTVAASSAMLPQSRRKP